MKILIQAALSFCLLINSVALIAQEANLGRVLTETVDGISDDAFKNRFDREEWKAKVANLNYYDVADSKSAMSEVVRDMKGRTFQNRSKGDLIRDILSVNNPGGIKSIIEKLLANIEPHLLNDGFDQAEVLRKFDELE